MNYRRAAFCCEILRAKGLNAKHIHKEIFSVLFGKVLSRKAIHKRVENLSLLTKKSKQWCESGCDSNQKTFMLRFSTHR
jgi:hypothetical protein